MAPMQLDMNRESYMVDIIPSKIVEMIAVIHILANRSRYEFSKKFTDSLYSRLSEKSRSFLELISGINFPGVEFMGFFIYEGIYNDFNLFLEKVSGYEAVDFIYLALDKCTARENIESVMHNRKEYADFRSGLCSDLWKGKDEAVEALLYDTENYKRSLLELAREICSDDEFVKTVEGLEGVYKQSEDELRHKLLGKTPLEFVAEIKGKSFSTLGPFQRYLFFPSYFMREVNIAAWDEDNGNFMLFYNVKIQEKPKDEEIDRFLSVMKSLSDRTRLQILQRLRNEPAYGKLLAEELKLSTATISRQLEQLRSMNLILEEKTDNFKYFKLNWKEIDRLIQSIKEFFSEK